MKIKMKKGSHRYDISRPRYRHEHNYSSVKLRKMNNWSNKRHWVGKLFSPRIEEWCLGCDTLSESVGYTPKPQISTFVKVHVFFIVRNFLFYMGIIFCSSVALVWTFNTRGVYNFITKKAIIPVNLVPFFNRLSLLLCGFLKSGVTNELKSLFLLKSKKVRVIYSK